MPWTRQLPESLSNRFSGTIPPSDGVFCFAIHQEDSYAEVCHRAGTAWRGRFAPPTSCTQFHRNPAVRNTHGAVSAPLASLKFGTTQYKSGLRKSGFRLLAKPRTKKEPTSKCFIRRGSEVQILSPGPSCSTSFRNLRANPSLIIETDSPPDAILPRLWKPKR